MAPDSGDRSDLGGVGSPETPFLLDDLPLEIGLRPTLDRVADRLAIVVQSPPLTAPVLVSGDWGSGKTTLLRGVCRKLADAALTNAGTPTIMFEAWQYESANALLPALMRRVWDFTPDAFRVKEGAKALLWALVRWAGSVASRVAAPGFGRKLRLPPGLEYELDVAKAAKQAAKVLGDRKPPMAPVDGLRDAFAKLVQDAWPDRVPVVFIDDLALNQAPTWPQDCIHGATESRAHGGPLRVRPDSSPRRVVM